jgi:PKD repeat protein
MYKRAACLVLLVALTLVSAACDRWNPFGIPDDLDVDLDVETTSELGASTLSRIDDLNDMLDRGVEIGPETRDLIEQLNETIRNGVTAGFDEATLQRVDELLRRIEDGFKIGLDQETLDSLDDLISTIDRAPSQWESTATEIIRTLEGSAGTVAGQMASEIKGILQEARTNAEQLVATGGIEFRCNVDFLGVRAGDTVQQFVGRSIIGRLKAVITGQEAEPPVPMPWVCHIFPDQVNLTWSGDRLVPEEAVVAITGFNYVDQNTPEAYVVDEEGQTVASVQLFPFRKSRYQLEVNLQDIDLGALPARSRIVFQWPNVPDTSAIAIVRPDAVPQPRVEITAASTGVHEGPGTEYEQIGRAEQGAIYVVTGRNGSATWWQIEHGTGVGWVAAASATRIDELEVSVAVDIPLPPLVADFRASPQSGAAPFMVAFVDASSGGPTSYLWHFGDGGTSTERNPTHAYSKSGSYTVKLTISGPQGSVQKEMRNYIQVSQPMPVANFSCDDTDGEMPHTVRFTDKSTGEPARWEWNFGDGSPVSASQNPTHTYEKAGNFTAVLRVSNDAGQSTKKLQIQVVMPLPVADFSASTRSGKAPLTMRFTDNSTGEPTAWTWDFGDGQSSRAQNPRHTYNRRGVYTVRLTATNARGSDYEHKRSWISVGLPNCSEYPTLRVSEEGTGRVDCPSGYVLKGIRCSGEYCDNKELFCCKYMEGVDSEANNWTSPWISEESRSRSGYAGNRFVRTDLFVVGISCKGEYCDDVRMRYVITPNVTNTGQGCHYLGEISEERPSEARCPDGYFVAGMRCRGSYCDNINLYCCQAE